jgi:membrane protein implicated in regulation of membrane protease activity
MPISSTTFVHYPILPPNGFALCLSAHGQPVYFYTHTRLDGLLLGVALAAFQTFWPKWFQKLQQQRLLLLAIVAIGLWRLYVDRDKTVDGDEFLTRSELGFVGGAADADVVDRAVGAVLEAEAADEGSVWPATTAATD